MGTQKSKYKTEPMKMWEEVRQYKQKFFQDYQKIKKNGGNRNLSGTSISLTFHAGFGNTAMNFLLRL